MHELDDHTLLRQFAEQNSETAFAALVARHLDKVYSAALRHTRNAHAAEEITQAVFVILAKKSGRLGAKVILAGWLYETARLTALTYIRSEIRRARREQEAHMQTALNESDLSRHSAATAKAWPHIAPLLDDALAGLSAADRYAVVLRYFDGKSLGEVGAAMGASEDAAKKRVTRAVEKLRGWFTKRGVTLTATVLTAAISANSVQAAPLGLAATVTATAVKGAAVSGSTLTLIKGALKVMAWTKAKMAAAVGLGALLATGMAIVTIKEIHEHRASAWETEFLNTNIVSILNETPPLVEILPTKFPQSKGWAYSGGVLDQKMVGVNKTLKWISDNANTTDLLPERHIYPDDFPTNYYDYIVNLPTGSSQALQKELKEQFGLVQKVEIRETNVFLLQTANRNAQGLKLHGGPPNKGGWSMANGTSKFEGNDMTMADLARFLEIYLATPVIDRTGISGHFDISLKLNMDTFPMEWSDHHIEDFRPALLNQLGLELVPSRAPVEMLVVEKVK